MVRRQVTQSRDSLASELWEVQKQLDATQYELQLALVEASGERDFLAQKLQNTRMLLSETHPAETETEVRHPLCIYKNKLSLLLFMIWISIL